MTNEEVDDKLYEYQQELENQLNQELESATWWSDRFLNSLFMKMFLENYFIVVYDKELTKQNFDWALKEAIEEREKKQKEWFDLNKDENFDFEIWIDELDEDYSRSVRYAHGIYWGDKKPLSRSINQDKFDDMIDSSNFSELKETLDDFYKNMYYHLFPLIF